MAIDHTTFVSPLTWRYGSVEMRQIWSEVHKRALMRRIWVALATIQQKAGMVTAEQLADLRQHERHVDIARSLVIERDTRHDVMAEIHAFAEQCPVGGKIIHLGATSADITDNVDVLRQRQAATLLLAKLRELLTILAGRIEDTADIVVMAYTHIQPAEPTTLGYRLAVYAQDLFEDLKALESFVTGLRGKGIKGAVGTQASFQELLQHSDMTPAELEAGVMALLELPFFPVATQTYPRRQDLHLQQVLAGLAASLHKFALDFRLLQSPAIGEWAEPFGRQQVGSSAMPFKRNPVNTENICSLARYVASLSTVAWENASQAILERSLDDSANRRLMHAESFLAIDEMIGRATRVVTGMLLDQGAMHRNLATYGPFAATERLLMALVAAGADRQAAHEWIRRASLKAWDAIQNGKENPLVSILVGDERIGRYLAPDQVRQLMDASTYTGTAAPRARTLAQTIRDDLQSRT